ncbi:MAG: glutamine amidotransferase [Myxococcales bacterium]|nr:glutamine amidotransferase [Myxococcales bacterium]
MPTLESVSLQLGNPGGTPVAVVVAMLVAAMTLLGIRELSSVTLAWRRRLLLGLRLATAAVALLLALQPRWISERVEVVQGRLLVLLDVSRSMQVRDDGASRATQASELVARWRKEAAVPFDLYGFGSELRPLKTQALQPHDLARDDESRLRRALDSAVERHPDDLGAIVVVTDGADTTPDFSAAQLAEFGVRVHTVALGSERDLGDDAIVSVKADPVAFLRQSAEVEVVVRLSDADAARVAVSLRRDGQVVAERGLEVGDDGLARAVLPFVPDRLGRSVYSLSIPVDARDRVPENNERAFLVRVTRDRLRVLLVCGAPSWDTRFLRAFLKSDPAIDLITFFILTTHNDIRLAPAEELSLIPFPTDELFREHLESFDVVIFQDFNYGPYQMVQYLPRIRDYVLAGGSFAMIGGSKAFGAGGYVRTPVAEILPVAMEPGERAVMEGAFAPRLAAGLERHPVVELAPDPEQNAAAWQRLAQLVGMNKLTGLTDDALALLHHPEAKLGDGTPMPVLVVGSPGQGRSLALASDSAWRWGMATAGRTGDPSAYEKFWDRALRWLARDPLLEPARVETDRERYGPGAALRARMRLQDARHQPLVNAEVVLRVEQSDGQVVHEAPVTSDAVGAAEVELEAPMQPGGYRLAVIAPDGQSELADEGFVVEAGGDELADPRARPGLLKDIARITGGSASTASSAGALQDLDRSRSRAVASQQHRPFASAVFFLVLVVVFGVEWGLRRAWGLA